MTQQKKLPIRIALTPEQKELINQALGREVSALEITTEELEERVSPGGLFSSLPSPGQIGVAGSLDTSPLLNVKLVQII